MALPPPNDRPPLTRDDIRNEVMRRLNISRLGANMAMNELFHQMAVRLAAGESLAFPRFGILRSHVRPARIGQGIRAGKQNSRKRVLRFSPSNKVRQSLKRQALRFYARKNKEKASRG